jgi:hypothetical protein
MKNSTLVGALRQFNTGFLISITAKLKRGGIEKGLGIRSSNLGNLAPSAEVNYSTDLFYVLSAAADI